MPGCGNKRSCSHTGTFHVKQCRHALRYCQPRAAEPDCGIVKTVWFSYPKLAEFAEMVEALLSQRGSAVDPAAVRNACVDYQVDARERLSVAAAVRLAEELAVGNGYSGVV